MDIFCTISFNSSWFLNSDAYLFLIAKKGWVKTCQIDYKKVFVTCFQKTQWTICGFNIARIRKPLLFQFIGGYSSSEYLLKVSNFKRTFQIYICTKKRTKIHYFLNLTSFYRLGQVYKNIFVCFFGANQNLKESFWNQLTFAV